MLPDAVNFTALSIRFSSAARNRTASPIANAGRSSRESTLALSPFAAARPASESAAARVSARRSKKSLRRLKACGLAARGIDEQRRQRGQMLGVGLDRIDPSPFALAEFGGGKQFADGEDAGERRAHLMGERREHRSTTDCWREALRARVLAAGLRGRFAAGRLRGADVTRFAPERDVRRFETILVPARAASLPEAPAESRRSQPNFAANVVGRDAGRPQFPDRRGVGGFGKFLPGVVENEAMVAIERDPAAPAVAAAGGGRWWTRTNPCPAPHASRPAARRRSTTDR